MTATKLGIYNLALLSLRETPLALITEVRESRYVLDAYYDQVLAEMLEAGFWRFAMRTVSITQDTSVTPSFGFTYAHDFPTDWVKLWGISANEFMLPLLDQYIEEGNLIFANLTPIYMRYVSSSTSGYGGDLSRWTARFAKAFSDRLALNAAMKATGASGNMIVQLVQMADRSLREALSFEAMREPSRRAPEGSWAAAGRSRGMGRSKTGHYWDR